MPDLPLPLSQVIDRVTTRGDAVPESARGDLSALGHLADAAQWIGEVQRSWPPVPPGECVEMGVAPSAFPRYRFAALLATDDSAGSVMTGVRAAESAADEGASAILLRDSCFTGSASAAVIGLLTGSDASAVTGPDLDSQAWMSHAAATRDAMRSSRPHLASPVELLDAIGDRELALLTGVLIGAAARRTPVLLDCVPSLAAALVAQRLSYRAVEWWWCSHRPADPAADLAIDRLDFHPYADLHIARPGIAPHIAWQGMTLAVGLVRAAE